MSEDVCLAAADGAAALATPTRTVGDTREGMTMIVLALYVIERARFPVLVRTEARNPQARVTAWQRSS